MFSNRLTFAALAVACVTAAGAGGYFASRQNTEPAVVAQATPASQAQALDSPVQETEAIVDQTVPPLAAPERASTATLPAPSSAGTSRRRSPPAATSTRARARQEPPALARAWPASTGSQPQPTSAPGSSTASSSAPDNSTPAPVDDRAALETLRAPEPPQKVFEELVVSPNSVIGLQTETRISSDTARIEDRVEAKVTRDVKVGDAIAIPAGSRAIGSVVQVEGGGKFKERARLGIRFTTLVLADGTRMPMSTETIYREGEAPGNSSAAKIGGGAVGGAILGAILGGGKGAAIGGSIGAAGGTAAVMAGTRNAAILAAGTSITVRILAPVTVTVER